MSIEKHIREHIALGTSGKNILPLRSNIIGRKIHGQAVTFAGTANRTFQLQATVERDCSGIQLVFDSVEAIPATWLVSVAATETAANAYQPVKGGVADYANAWSTPESVVVASGATGAPVRTLSTMIPISLLDRTDVVGAPPLVLIRMYMAGATAYTALINVANNNTEFEAISSGRLWRMSRNVGDFVTTPANFQTGVTLNPNPVFPAVGFKTLSNGFGISMLTVGDSTFEGRTSGAATSLWDGFGFYAQTGLSSNSFTVEHINQGWTAQTGVQYTANGLTAIASYAPNVAVYLSASINDAGGGWTQAIIDAALNRTMAFINTCAVNKIIPIVCTPFPGVGSGETGYSFRVALLAKIRALANTGIHVLDVESICATGTSSRIWDATLTADNIHPNRVANALIATSGLMPILAKIRFANTFG